MLFPVSLRARPGGELNNPIIYDMQSYKYFYPDLSHLNS